MQRILEISLSLAAILVIAATSYYTFNSQQSQLAPAITQVRQPATGTQNVIADSSDGISAEVRNEAKKLYDDGNYKEAYEAYIKIATDPKAGGQPLVRDLSVLYQCIQRMRYYSQWENLIEKVIAAHSNDWRVLQAVAGQYRSAPKYGIIIDNKFQRAPQRMSGAARNSQERDRIRSLQLLNQAMPLALQDSNKSDTSKFLVQFAQAWQNHQGAWRLQTLTNLDELPDYGDGYGSGNGGRGAPVDKQNNPVVHHLPPSWDAAKSDGERYRWALDQASKIHPPQKIYTQYLWAQFLHSQFGVQTMQQFGAGFVGRQFQDDEKHPNTGRYALNSLSDTETIAQLATGIKRFDLPEEFNFIRIFREIAAVEDDTQSTYVVQASKTLAQLFQNRRQYPKAAKVLRNIIKRYPQTAKNSGLPIMLKAIVGNWGAFDPISGQTTNEQNVFTYKFRNAQKVTFTAYKIDVSKLLADVKTHIEMNQDSDMRYAVNDITNLIYHKNSPRYINEQVTQWSLDLEPRDSHYDKRITVEVPIKATGAYKITANVDKGNTSSIVYWLNNTSMVKMATDNGQMFYLADSVTGKPLPNTKLEFFGFQRTRTKDGKTQNTVKKFVETADENGLVNVSKDLAPTNYQWITTARNDRGRFAYLGFHGIWYGQLHDQEYKQSKVFIVTDRPVYRPNQMVKSKFWLRKAQYDKDDVSHFANISASLDLYNPRGEKILTKEVKTDEYGGFEFDWQAPEDAMLGVYRFHVHGIGPNQISGGNTFRVEEYKKPEYEVTVEAPDKPVALGEVIKAKVKANYYFGSPVTEGTVKVTIRRYSHSQNWYPYRAWDWCFGPGYWWYSYDYPWYPGWNKWVGCMRPMPWWYGTPHNPPELISQQELELTEDGTVELEIDTAIAKELHSSSDQRYEIIAEVRDQSRRTIVGNGSVLATRKPFTVFSWVDRGYYHAGDTINASFHAKTLDNQPVQGQGKLRLLKVVYNRNNEPVEKVVQTWDLDTDKQGLASQQIKAKEKGQYRISYEVDDTNGHIIEGGYIFTIIGDGFDGGDFRFSDLELIPDKAEYRPGDTVKLQINTNRRNSTVLLFVRPSNGIYLPPKRIDLRGKSTVEEITVIQKDMPNFFVEAVTVANGRIFQSAKEIVVPPEKRVINVEVEPSAETYKPGEKGTVKIRLTDYAGKPFEGSTIVSIYDKSVEYISGGSNVPDIQEFFWKWRRNHNPRHESNLNRYSYERVPLRGETMGPLGIFGHTVAEDLYLSGMNQSVRKSAPRGMGGMGGMGRVEGEALAAPAARMEMALDDSMGGLNAAADKLSNAGLIQNGTSRPETQAPNVEAAVRENFADTALWVGTISTNKEGLAEIEFEMPENLTTWKVNVWALGHGTNVGEGHTEVITRKDLIVRLQAPRFFTETDEVMISANVHNYLDAEKLVTTKLIVDGEYLVALDQVERKVSVQSNGEARVDWMVRVKGEGETTIQLQALTDEESDAVQMSFPVYIHGILKTESWAGTIRPSQNNAKLSFTVPAERKAEQSILEVRYSPTLAAAMVDALPYMLDYPYGCTEQTLNRFLPAAITQQTLLNMDLNLEDLRDKRTNLNAQEIGNDEERAKQWKRFDRHPVFSQVEMQKIVKTGVTRLVNMQNPDGGWGWFGGGRQRSYPHTTAMVIHGLQVARQNGVELDAEVIARGINWLKNQQDTEVEKLKRAVTKTNPYKLVADNRDALIYMILTEADVNNTEMQDFLYRDRTKLSVYGLVTYGLGLETVANQERLTMVVRNIEQFLVQDEANETAYLELPAGHAWWYWYGDEIETNAFYLKLLARVKPQSQQASRLVKYLLNNRKHATYWKSTRDTSLCVEAFSEYLKATGEASPDMTVEVWLDGKKHKEVKINSSNLFSFDNKLVLKADEVTSGEHTVELRRQGKGPVYFNVYSTNFTQEDFIEKAGLEIKVERRYYKLVADHKDIDVAGNRGQVVNQKKENYQRIPIQSGDKVESGDIIEVELLFESKNDYEYLMFEDRKAAGIEPVDLRSGWVYSGLSAYREMRDESVNYFLHRISRGKHSFTYKVRAEIPGKFSALPTIGYAMYAPELRSNSNEIKIEIVDK
ncbi:MAG: MG2 domain-containing protein [Planctomycetota bacterium]|nr:MG2 domain-containing protein [Planctomycetota bacterium]